MSSKNNKVIFVVEMILTGTFLLLGILVLILGTLLENTTKYQDDKTASVEQTAISTNETIEETSANDTSNEDNNAAIKNEEANEVLPTKEINDGPKSIFEKSNSLTFASGTLQQFNDGSILYYNNYIGYSIYIPKADYISYSESQDLRGIQLRMDEHNYIIVSGGYNEYEEATGFLDYSQAIETGYEYSCFQVYYNANVGIDIIYSNDNNNKYGNNSNFAERCRKAVKETTFDFEVFADAPEETYDVVSEYMLPYSDINSITENDIQGFTKWECKVARNEIYARHGRLFNDEELQTYFDNCSWYDGYILPDDFTEDLITPIERANIDVIVNYEKKMGYR